MRTLTPSGNPQPDIVELTIKLFDTPEKIAFNVSVILSAIFYGCLLWRLNRGGNAGRILLAAFAWAFSTYRLFPMFSFSIILLFLLSIMAGRTLSNPRHDQTDIPVMAEYLENPRKSNYRPGGPGKM